MLINCKIFLLLIPFTAISYQGIAQIQKKENQKLVVVIDPGHGGRDSGALSRNGIMEKDIVLSIALKIDSLYRLYYSDKLNLYLTRYTDTLISLRNRTLLAKRVKANVFISLHLNSSQYENLRGMEIFLFPQRTDTSDRSIFLGLKIQRRITQELYLKNRGIKFENFQVLKESQSNFLALLLEFCYVSNIDDEQLIRNSKSLKIISSIIIEELQSMM